MGIFSAKIVNQHTLLSSHVRSNTTRVRLSNPYPFGNPSSELQEINAVVMAQKKAPDAGSAEYLSHALNYETDLLDLIKDRNGLQNAELIVQHAFAVLDKCIPELGQFVRVIKLIRDQLYDAVYSEKITECGGKITRLPYFKIIDLIEVEAEKRLDVKSKDVDSVQKRLFEKQVEYETLEADFAAAGSEIRTLQKSLMAQMERNEELEEKITELERTMAAQEEKSEENILALRMKIAEMKHDLDAKQQVIDDLEKYKHGHQELENSFFTWPAKIMSRVLNEQNALPAVSYGEKKSFRTSSEAGRYEAAQTIAKTLTKQIEELEKQLVDGFEKESATIKTALVNRRLITDNLDPGIEAEEEEMSYQAKKSVRSEHNFSSFMSMASKELDLLREHEQNMASLLAARALKAKQAENQIDPDDQSKDVVPTEPVAEATENPFIPNDIVLSKYSIVVQVSQDGLHFYDLPVNEPCGMCGLAAVLVCPHHILSRQITVPLTPNTNYIRIIRPSVRSTTSEIVMPSADAAKPRSPELARRPLGPTPSTDIRDTVSSTGVQMAYGRPKPRDLSAETSIDRFTKAVDERVEAKLRGTKPRTLNEEQMYIFCEDILGYFFSVELINQKPAPFIDNFFSHVELAYRSRNAAHLVAGDLLYNLPVYIKNHDRYLQLFGMALNGVIDFSLLKYASLLADATLTIDWRHPADYWAFALVVYPFLDEEDADVVQMNFTSFTEGRISSVAVLEYQLFCLLRGTELRYQQMFEQLHEMSSGQPFTEDEFLRAARDLLPKGCFDPDKTRGLYQEAYQTTLFWNSPSSGEATSWLDSKGTKSGKQAKSSGGVGVDFYKDAISTERCAQIMCYLDMLAIIAFVKDNLWARVLEMRTASAAAQYEKTSTSLETTGSGAVEEKATRSIVRYNDAYKLAVQLTKFKHFKMRENLDFEEKEARRSSFVDVNNKPTKSSKTPKAGGNNNNNSTAATNEKQERM